MLANHGPVVARKDVEAACNPVEKLEDTAQLAMTTHSMQVRRLTLTQIHDLVTHFNVEWDT